MRAAQCCSLRLRSVLQGRCRMPDMFGMDKGQEPSPGRLVQPMSSVDRWIGAPLEWRPAASGVAAVFTTTACLTFEVGCKPHLGAHEQREQVCSPSGIIQRQAAQSALCGIHRGLPQLLWHHLAQALHQHHAINGVQLGRRGCPACAWTGPLWSATAAPASSRPGSACQGELVRQLCIGSAAALAQPRPDSSKVLQWLG